MNDWTTAFDPRSVVTPSTARELQKSSGLTLVAICFLMLLVIIGTAELFCRFVIGLGDPPLYQTDGAMGYVLQPSKTYYRFHDRFAVNRYGMRADDFPPQKSSPNELRVLVVGDSVVYGGVQIDQSEIDTEILGRNLRQQFVRPVVVGNVSAKGWGPPSELAYLKKFGTLDADIMIVELSSHNYGNAPTFVPVVGISPDFPSKTPSLALADLFQTYLFPRYLHMGPASALDRALAGEVPSEHDIAACRDAERDLFSFARVHHAKVALVQHLTSPELAEHYRVGYYANQAVAREENVPYVDDADELRVQVKSGHSPYYDPIHLNKLGQPILAHALQRAVNLALRSD